ncbi:hypothetical protein ABFA25_13680 [Mycobacterium lepromatosis]|nr:hypothetical protein [Mycobacterium lepromatosis]
MRNDLRRSTDAAADDLDCGGGQCCFVVSGTTIAIVRFILGNEVLAMLIWWSYALEGILITAGFFFGRE